MVPAAIIAVGLALFVTGNRRTHGSVRTAGAVIIGVGVLLIAVSWAIDTDMEKVENRSKQLVESAGHNDWQKSRRCSPPPPTSHSSSAAASTSRPHGADRRRPQGFRKHRPPHAWVASENLQQTGGLITTEMGRVFSDQDKVGGHQIPSDWQLDWQKENGQWVVGTSASSRSARWHRRRSIST